MASSKYWSIQPSVRLKDFFPALSEIKVIALLAKIKGFIQDKWFLVDFTYTAGLNLPFDYSKSAGEQRSTLR